MPSDRVAKVLELAASLPDDERAELADRLWSTVPDVLSDEWTAEIRGRVEEMNAAEARGERPGLVLTFDEMLAHVKGHADDE
jgi:hypothetical protein